MALLGLDGVTCLSVDTKEPVEDSPVRLPSYAGMWRALFPEKVGIERGWTDF